MARSTLPFSWGRRGAAEPGLDVEARSELEEVGVEADGVAGALDDDGLGVVEEPLAWRSAEGSRSPHERAAKRFDAHVEDELGPHRARVREDHDERPERPLAAGHRERADVRPVDLRLLAGQRLDAQEDLATRRGPARRERSGEACEGCPRSRARRACRRCASRRASDSARASHRRTGCTARGRAHPDAACRPSGRRLPRTRATTSKWTPSCAAIVPRFQCSP